jgi:site-specific DNA-cytosine methylase
LPTVGVYIYVGEIWPEPEKDFSKELDVAVAGSSVEQWSVADLAALYAEHRSSLVRQAERILRSNAPQYTVFTPINIE